MPYEPTFKEVRLNEIYAYVRTRDRQAYSDIVNAAQIPYLEEPLFKVDDRDKLLSSCAKTESCMMLVAAKLLGYKEEQ